MSEIRVGSSLYAYLQRTRRYETFLVVSETSRSWFVSPLSGGRTTAIRVAKKTLLANENNWRTQFLTREQLDDIQFESVYRVAAVNLVRQIDVGTLRNLVAWFRSRGLALEE